MLEEGLFSKKEKEPEAAIGTSYSKIDGVISHYGSIGGRAFMHTFKHKTPHDQNGATAYSYYNGIDDRHPGFAAIHKTIEHSLRNNHGMDGRQLAAAHFNEI